MKEAKEYAVGRITEEHPDLVRERVLDSELSDDLGFEQEVSRRDVERFQATLQRQSEEGGADAPEPIIRGEEDTPFDDADQEAVTYTPEREGFYGQLLNRFTDGRDDRVNLASAMSVYQEDPGFARELDRLGNKYGVNPAALMAVMDFETGGTFDPSIRNAAGSGATGLIQFMPATARSLGTTTDDLASMSRADQMKYVEAYFDQFGDRIRGGEVDDLYMAVLWPRAIGKDDGYVIFRQGTIAYDQNRGLDINGDGTVTKYEAASRVARKFYGY